MTVQTQDIGSRQLQTFVRSSHPTTSPAMTSRNKMHWLNVRIAFDD